MKPSGEEQVTRVFTVRGCPVGFQAGRWGGALVAVERGEFPISPTGWRSMSGAGESAVTPGFLEELAKNHERERRSLVQRLQEARKPVGAPILNYIHVSGAYEQAIQYGFFATDRDRAALWSEAHQLLCLVESDPRFQPVPEPTYVVWTREHCDGAQIRAREFKALLVKLAAGDMPAVMPMRLIGANAYLALPPKPGGEPKVDLGGYTAEMALGVGTMNSPGVKRRERVGPEPVAKETPDIQLGLFDPPPGTARVRVSPDEKKGMRPSF